MSSGLTFPGTLYQLWAAKKKEGVIWGYLDTDETTGVQGS